ncbi:MAG: dihydroorotase, partial [Actinomycetota bacterium]|nr:dihydroorotase [Actinomycetota bacterium]
MIEIPGFIDLHTHTRYPDDNKFPFIDIDDSAINGGFSTILAMPNSEIPIDSIKNLRIAEEIDKKLKTKVHRVGSLTKNLEGKELVNYKEFVENGITIFSDDGKSLIDDHLADEAFKQISKLGGAVFQHCEKSCHS